MNTDINASARQARRVPPFLNLHYSGYAAMEMLELLTREKYDAGKTERKFMGKTRRSLPGENFIMKGVKQLTGVTAQRGIPCADLLPSSGFI